MWRWLEALAVLSALQLHSAVGLAQAKRVLGTGVSLVPPPGFSLSTRFPGFENAAHGASIAVTELPGSAADVEAAMSKEALAQEGLTLLEAQAVTIGTRAGSLARVAQQTDGVPFVKWMLAFGDESRAVMIVAAFPEAESAALADRLRKAVLSASWRPSRGGPPLEGLPFRVTDRAGFEIADRMSSAVLLAEVADTAKLEAADASLVVSATFAEGEVDVPALGALAEQRMRKTPDLIEIGNVVGEAVTVDGLAAYELTCDAKQASTGGALRVYRGVIADGRLLFHVQGLAPADRADALIPRFRKVARGLKRVPATPRPARTGPP